MMKNIRGFNLVELMVAITIGLIILLTMLAVVNNTSKSFRGNDDNARLLDIGTLAMRQLSSDLSQAGFFGEQDSLTATLEPKQSLESVAPILTEDNATDKNKNLTRAVWQVNKPWEAPPSTPEKLPGSAYTFQADMPMINIRSGTKLIKPGDASLLNAEGLYLEADPGGGILFKGADYKEVSDAGDIRNRVQGAGGEANIYEYQSYTYYIGNDPTDIQNRNPMLIRRMYNTASGNYIDQPIAEGIESMSIQWGVDLVGQGVATTLIADRDEKLMPTITDWGKVVSATIFLLVRVPAPDYTDPPGTIYTVGGGLQGNGRTVDGTASDTQTGFRFRRRIFTVTVQLRNRSQL